MIINSSKWNISYFEIPRMHIYILIFLCLATAILASANIHFERERSDSLANFASGITLAETGIYGPDAEVRGWHMREPLVPILIAGYHLLRSQAGLPVVTMSCVTARAQAKMPCMELTAPYRHVNVLFLIAAAASAFLLVHRTTGSAVSSYVAFLLTVGSAVMLDDLNRVLTETPAAALMAMSVVFLQILLARRRVWAAVALGASLGALVLTKVVFAYFWIVLAMVLLAFAFWDRNTLRSLVKLTAIMSVTHCAIVGGWMLRNYVTAGDFEILEGRSFRVLSVRSSYNDMRMDEYWAGYLYYLPMVGPSGLIQRGFDPRSFERFDTTNPEGFRSLGQRKYREAMKSVVDAAHAQGLPTPTEREVFAAVQPMFRNAILSNPLGHLRVTILLAFGSTFPEAGFGTVDRTGNGRLSDLWGIDMPQFLYVLGKVERTLFNAATTLAILALPFLLWLRGRNVAGLFISLPVLYSHGVYSVATHFIPRYAEPEIPLRNVALCICLFVIIGALVRRFRSTSVAVTPREENFAPSSPPVG